MKRINTGRKCVCTKQIKINKYETSQCKSLVWSAAFLYLPWYQFQFLYTAFMRQIFPQLSQTALGISITIPSSTATYVSPGVSASCFTFLCSISRLSLKLQTADAFFGFIYFTRQDCIQSCYIEILLHDLFQSQSLGISILSCCIRC